MLWSFAKKFQFAADRFIPEPFVFCAILTFIVFIFGLLITDLGPLSLIIYWYDGLWSMISFAFQMSFLVICCGAAARAPQIEIILNRLARFPKSPEWAMFLLLVFGFISSLISWAFSLALTPIFAIYLSKHVKGLHFPLMIATGCSTMVLGHCWSPSASVYALIASKGHFMESTIGILAQGVTTYNPVNTVLFFILVSITIFLGVFTKPPADEIIMYSGDLTETAVTVEEISVTPAEKMNNCKLMMTVIGIAGIMYIFNSFLTKGIIKSLDFNFLIFFFLTIDTFLYNTPHKFVAAFKKSITLAAEIMLQFPLYGGIMHMMSGSGLTNLFATGLIQVATVKTMPLFSFWASSFVNLFVPSQGGQWILLGPVLVKAVHALNADLPLVINAFVYGDEATLIQPLYIIPALSLVGMKLKEVWGFLAFIWFIWFIGTSIGLLVLPGLI